MAVRKKGGMPFHRADPCDHTIDPGANLIGAFATRAAVAEKDPPGRLRPDLFRGQTFVFAVVPFHQIMMDLSVLADTG